MFRLAQLDSVIEQMTQVIGSGTTDFSSRQLRAFLMIAKASNDEEPINQQDLVDLLHMSLANACETVQKFVDFGLMTRERSVADRRVKFLVLTDQGRTTANKIVTHMETQSHDHRTAA